MSSFSGLDVVAVDMETANAQRASVCAVGIALVRAGEVVATEKILVQPPTGLDSFSALNRGIHGICAEDVKDAPAWNEVAGQLEVLGSQLPLVAHNAAFDRGAYEAACAEAGRTAQPMEWLDLLELSRRLRPDSRQHTLPVLAEAYGVTLENHHDAEQDARACAEVLVAIAKEQGVQRLGELWPQGGQVGTAAGAAVEAEVPAGSGAAERGQVVEVEATTEAEAPTGQDRGSSAFTPSALRRSRFNDDGPRPWEQPAPPQQTRASMPPGNGAAPHQWGDAPASQQQGRPNEGVRVAKKIGGAVMMLVALFITAMTAAGVGQVIEDLSAGDVSDVALGVGMTAVCALISIWLATTALRWMRG